MVHFFWRGRGSNRVGQDGGFVAGSWRSRAWFDVVVNRVGQDHRTVEIGVVRGF